jgi:hypothetical protein
VKGERDENDGRGDSRDAGRGRRASVHSWSEVLLSNACAVRDSRQFVGVNARFDDVDTRFASMDAPIRRIDRRGRPQRGSS